MKLIDEIGEAKQSAYFVYMALRSEDIALAYRDNPDFMKFELEESPITQEAHKVLTFLDNWLLALPRE